MDKGTEYYAWKGHHVKNDEFSKRYYKYPLVCFRSDKIIEIIINNS